MTCAQRRCEPCSLVRVPKRCDGTTQPSLTSFACEFVYLPRPTALAQDQQDTVRCAEVARWFVTRRPEALLGYSMFFAALTSGHAAVEEVIGTPHTKFFTRIASGIGSRLQTAPPWAANWVAAQQLVHNRSYGVMMGA